MPPRRQHNTRGPQDPRTLEEFIDDFAAFIRGQRCEYRHDLTVTSNPIKKARLHGQITACRILMTYLKDAKKQFKEAE